jgi:hypothetical protein
VRENGAEPTKQVTTQIAIVGAGNVGRTSSSNKAYSPVIIDCINLLSQTSVSAVLFGHGQDEPAASLLQQAHLGVMNIRLVR